MALKPLNSVGGFSVGEIPANVILANSDIFTNRLTVNTYANLGNVGNVYIGGGALGAVLSTDGNGALSWSSSPGVTEIQNGNSNVSIPTANGNIYINANNGADYQWVFDNTGVLTLANSGGYSIIASPSGSNVDIYTGGSQYTELFMIDGGNIQLNTAGGNYSWVFDNTGNATFPSGGTANLGNLVAVNYANIANELVVSGNANVTGNVTASNFSTTGSAGNISGANVIFANSFTSNGGLVDFSTSNANVQLGNVGNVHILGGSDGYVLQTDGTGNLSWTEAPNINEIKNGNSNVTIPSLDGAVYINANNGSDQQWTFDNSGVLTLANGSSITGQPNTAIYLYTNSSNYSGINLNDDGSTSNIQFYVGDGTYEWTMESSGNLILPNAASGYAVVTTPAGNNISIQTAGATYSQVILNDNSDILLYTNAQYYSYQFGADGTFLIGAGQKVDFNTNNANVQLGSNANVHLYGGNVGEVLQTDGAGNLNWYAISATGIQNGNSNVTIPDTNGNVYINANAGVDQQWNFGTNGTLYFPVVNSQTSIQEQRYGMGNLVGYNDGGWVLGEYNGTSYGTEGIRISPGIEGNVEVILPADQNAAGNALQLNNYVGNVKITANNNNWNFDNAGVLHTPGNIELGGNTIQDNSGGSGIQLYSGTDYAQLNYNNSSYVYVESSGVWLGVNAGTLQLDTTGNVIISQNLEVQGNIANANNISATNSITAGSANITNDLNVGGNIQTGGGSGGNISGVDYIFAQYANLSSDLNVNNNAYIQGTVTANYFYANNDANIAGNLTVQTNANINGNLTVGNISGVFANGTSNVAIPTVNGNVIISVNGTANVLTVTDTNVATAGNTITSGNVISNATFIGNTITSVGTYLTIASDQSANGSYNINLVPGGAGNVDVNSRYITSVADPINPQDAATKQYVDSVSQGLYIHPAANLLSATNLNATYTIGGVTLTVTDIIGNNTIQFSTAHGLSVDNDVTFTNSFNGLVGSPDVYYVDTIPAPNQITLKETYFGPIVNNLTPGTGLSEPSIGQAGVGATLTNAGANAALVVDSIATTVGERILVTGQSDQAQNGIYDVTTVGDGSTPWVLTRSSDGNSYVPQSSTALCAGSYFFIQNGNVYGGSSWVLSTTGEINIGVTNITFTQFSTGGAYTGTSGILVTGTQISANVDNVTTAIIGGNIAIKTGANLTTPNIGDATFSSLTWNTLSNGNINVSNVNASNTVLTNVLSVNTSATVNSFVSNTTANITTDLTVGGNTYLANSTGTQVVVGSGSGGNISGVNYLNANYANIQFDVFASGNANITGNLTANSSFLGETSITGNANISANLISNNFVANYDANIGGNANIGNTLFIGNTTSNVNISNGSANLTGNIFAGNASSNVSISNGSANLTGNIFAGNTTSNVSISNGDITLTGNINANAGNITITNANISNSITLGNTYVNWGTVTTAGIAANQTIAEAPATSITGIEFFIKGVDATGAKYSVATVQAVTDGANVDYAVYGGVNLNGMTGSLAVNIANGNIQLQVTPSSSNSTVWTTQYRLI